MAIFKTINELTLLESIANSDQFAIWDASENISKKATINTLYNTFAQTNSATQGRFLNNTTTTSGIFSLSGTASSNNTLHAGDRISLIPYNNGLQLWNSTDQNEIWSMSLPLSVTKGGTGATDAEKARENLGVVQSSSNVKGNMNNVDIGTSHWVLAGTAGSGSSLTGNRILFHMGPNGVSGYDSTTKTSLWSLNANTLNTINNKFSATLVSDCNNATQPLKLYYANASTANRPSSDNTWFQIICLWGSSYPTQMAWVENTTYAQRFWLRTKNANGWGSWYLYTSPSQAIQIVSGTTGNITVPANSTKSTSITVNVPTGYTRVMNGPCRTNGAVAFAYLQGGASTGASVSDIWIGNPWSSSITLTVTWEVLCRHI